MIYINTFRFRPKYLCGNLGNNYMSTKENLTTIANPAQPAGLQKTLLTIFGIIFLEFLIMGISLGTIPGFVHETLHFGNVIVGLVIGTQYLATLLSRHFAGKMADLKGGKKAVLLGLFLSSLSGIFCLLSSWLTDVPTVSLFSLVLGRILLGVGESYLVIGIFAWGFILAGSNHVGKVMVWNGMGMYGGMACGAPLGMLLTAQFSLATAFLSIIIFPAISYLLVLLLKKVPLPVNVAQLPFYKAVNLVWQSGTGLALASIGFGGIASFITLYFNQNGWAGSCLNSLWRRLYPDADFLRPFSG